jgi:hypothetical protein
MSAVTAFFSNTFLAPVFFWFLALIPVVILLYILKLRRTQIVISSTFLWVKSLQDLTANAPFQRLRKNLLLFLQILILLLLVIALARPFVSATGDEGAAYCVVIDASASMQTMEGDSSRLDLAKAEALSMVDTMTRGDTMMLVSFAQSADVLAESTNDKIRLRQAIRSIEAVDTTTNLRDVTAITRSLRPGGELVTDAPASLEIILFSDGGLSDSLEVGARAPDMTYKQIGETSDNAGIVALNVRRATVGQSQQQTFVLIHNESKEALKTTVTLEFNGSALAVEALEAPPGEQREILFSHGDFGEGILRVTLDHQDALAADNEAWLALQPAQMVKTLIVTEPDSTSGYYLKKALSLEPRAEVGAISPEDYIVNDDYDLTIFDGYAPESLPGGTLVFFDALPPLPGLSDGGDMERPPVLATEPGHPIMRFLNPENVSITRARRLTLPEGSRALMTTTGAALIADVSRGNQRILVVAFSIADSDWPINEISYPIFMQNLVSWAPRLSLSGEVSIATGKALTLIAAPGEESVTVLRPDGEEVEVELDPLRPVYYAATTDAGIYEVQREGGSQYFAVNLLDSNESSITPVETLRFGRREVVAEAGLVRQTRELWRWFVGVALAVLLGEWWIYSRRAWS